ncbi:LYR motif-containing protein 1 isoform X2 [Elephas maximus indicus]|uniref:LYR motif-containing protein 1 isoform X2 n=1 Tax=Elephas maximus indicus TaxID=99487 RepID=UPI0021167266|nr:LYR motif-containing protein 1 isoform X2 [Elephas maximus indicus]
MSFLGGEKSKERFEWRKQREGHVAAAERASVTQVAGPEKAGPFRPCLKMTTATRQEVLGLYRRIFRLARKWQAASGQMEDTIKEKQYILKEARTLFQKNKNLTDTDLIQQCIDECTARIEIGLHYQIPYPRFICLQWALPHYKVGDFEDRRN